MLLWDLITMCVVHHLWSHSVHWDINFPSKTTIPSFSFSALLNLQIVQVPLFRQFPRPIYWFFMNPLKIRFFSEPPWFFILKGTLSGLRQYLVIEIPLKAVKDNLHFTSKALFVLRFLSWFFGHVTKWLDVKDYVSFKFYDVAAWLSKNSNTYIVQYFKK